MQYSARRWWNGQIVDLHQSILTGSDLLAKRSTATGERSIVESERLVSGYRPSGRISTTILPQSECSRINQLDGREDKAGIIEQLALYIDIVRVRGQTIRCRSSS